MINYWENSEQIHDYILCMLGAPVVKVELDETQLDLAIESAVRYVEEHLPAMSPQKRRYLIEEGALGFAKHMLGMVRSKFQIKEGNFQLDARALIEESRDDLDFWRERIHDWEKKNEKLLA